MTTIFSIKVAYLIQYTVFHNLSYACNTTRFAMPICSHTFAEKNQFLHINLIRIGSMKIEKIIPSYKKDNTTTTKITKK